MNAPSSFYSMIFLPLKACIWFGFVFELNENEKVEKTTSSFAGGKDKYRILFFFLSTSYTFFSSGLFLSFCTERLLFCSNPFSSYFSSVILIQFFFRFCEYSSKFVVYIPSTDILFFCFSLDLESTLFPNKIVANLHVFHRFLFPSHSLQ